MFVNVPSREEFPFEYSNYFFFISFSRAPIEKGEATNGQQSDAALNYFFIFLSRSTPLNFQSKLN
jgi:uncharacterized protein with ParB-like and HNH nuclease domain